MRKELTGDPRCCDRQAYKAHTRVTRTSTSTSTSWSRSTSRSTNRSTSRTINSNVHQKARIRQRTGIAIYLTIAVLTIIALVVAAAVVSYTITGASADCNQTIHMLSAATAAVPTSISLASRAAAVARSTHCNLRSLSFLAPSNIGFISETGTLAQRDTASNAGNSGRRLERLSATLARANTITNTLLPAPIPLVSALSTTVANSFTERTGRGRSEARVRHCAFERQSRAYSTTSAALMAVKGSDEEMVSGDDASVVSSIKRSTRGSTKAASEPTDEVDEVEVVAKPKKRGRPPKRKAAKSTEIVEVADDASASDDSSNATPKKKRRGRPRKQVTSDDNEESQPESSMAAASRKTKPAAKVEAKTAAKAKPAKKAASHQQQTEQDEIQKLWNEEDGRKKGSYTYRIASWNVAGIRGLLKKKPDAIKDLCQKHDLDMLCLQETKLQETHLDDPKLKLRGHLLDDADYESYFSYSTTKKGYSGTAVFVRKFDEAAASSSGSTADTKAKTKAKSKAKQTSIGSFFSTTKSKSKAAASKNKGGTADPDDDKTKQGSSASAKSGSSSHRTQGIPPEVLRKLIPQQTTYKFGTEVDNEGRMVQLDFPCMSVANVYVPNSGQKLERLDYRTEGWDVDFLKFMQSKHADRGVPVLWLGDLNVAHTNLEVWNDGAKHLAKQAGVTVQERESFQRQLDSGFVDAFRHLHPTAKGHYSYWSQRAGNRAPNKGLRLDYFICSSDMLEDDGGVIVRDSFMLPEQEGSDHCPVVLELEVK